MTSDTMYAVLLDAGSSGTRVYGYQWKYNGEPEKTEIKIIPGWEKKTSDSKLCGIHNLAPDLQTSHDDNKLAAGTCKKADDYLDPILISKLAAETDKKVADYLDPLFAYARQFLQEHKIKIKTTPLFVLATGGMRRHKEEHYKEYVILRDAITKYINNAGFLKPFFDTISGEDEALYGWVAANHVDGCFGRDKATHGFVEMGGESAQFAVEPLGESDFGSYDGLLRRVRIWDRSYLVFVKTWMGIGGESAWKNHEIRLRQTSAKNDPCLPKGYSHDLGGGVSVVGTGDFEACMQEAISLLKCPDKDCTEGNLCIYHPYPDPTQGPIGCLIRDNDTGNLPIKFDKTQFRGASVYRHATYGILTDSSGHGTDDFSAFWNTVKSYSDNDWETLKLKKPEEEKNGYKYLAKSFFTAAMVMATLFIGFGVPMPREAISVARNFAQGQARKVHEEAKTAVKKADDRVKAASGSREMAEDAVKEAAGADEQVGNLLRDPKSVKELEDCRAIYLKKPTGANRQDYVRAAELVYGVLTDANKSTRETIEKVFAEIETEKEALDGFAIAQSRLRQAERSVITLGGKTNQAGECEAKKIDDCLERLFETQSKEMKYTTIPGADWTLGRIVLYVNSCKPSLRSRYNWSEKRKALGEEDIGE